MTKHHFLQPLRFWSSVKSCVNTEQDARIARYTTTKREREKRKQAETSSRATCIVVVVCEPAESHEERNTISLPPQSKTRE